MIAAGERRGSPSGYVAVVKVLDEHERTMAFAQLALGQISSLRLNATPRNYEIWYVYAKSASPRPNPRSRTSSTASRRCGPKA
jgi:hypothetical protein